MSEVYNIIRHGWLLKHFVTSRIIFEILYLENYLQNFIIFHQRIYFYTFKKCVGWCLTKSTIREHFSIIFLLYHKTRFFFYSRHIFIPSEFSITFINIYFIFLFLNIISTIFILIGNILCQYHTIFNTFDQFQSIIFVLNYFCNC